MTHDERIDTWDIIEILQCRPRTLSRSGGKESSHCSCCGAQLQHGFTNFKNHLPSCRLRRLFEFHE